MGATIIRRRSIRVTEPRWTQHHDRMRSDTRWRPILNGAVCAQAIAAVEAIANETRKLCGIANVKDADSSLAGGTSGLAVFHAYLATARHSDVDRNTAIRFLEQAVEDVSSTRMEPSLHSGFTGVAWAVSHLERRLRDSHAEDTATPIDEVLREFLDQSPWHWDYDLLNGLVGFGVYALERLPRPTAAACLELVVDRLDEIAERGAQGVTWFTDPELIREEGRNGHYNLGLAHGMPGVIALLGAVCAAGVAREKAHPLLEGAVAWLNAQRLPAGMSSSFPSYLERGLTPTATRSAWCYGDPGIAAALLFAARSTGDRALERRAIEIGLHAAKRPPETSGVVDAGLCHGAAGLGHVFNRIYQAGGEEIFADAARFWLERTLEMQYAGSGIAGFSAMRWDPDAGERRPVAERGILTGVAGIGLALLAAATPVMPSWDRVLLVSIPPERHAGQRQTRSRQDYELHEVR